MLDSAILLFVLLLVGITLRIFQALGAWVPVGARVPPEEAWKALGSSAKLFVVFAFVIAMGPVYFVLCEASPRQATIGKHFLNIYVTGDDGKRISNGRAVGRWVVKLIVGWFGMAWISVITILATKERKGVHDAVANTLVLRGQPVPGGALKPWRIAAALGFPFVWMLGTFLAIY